MSNTLLEICVLKHGGKFTLDYFYSCTDSQKMNGANFYSYLDRYKFTVTCSEWSYVEFIYSHICTIVSTYVESGFYPVLSMLTMPCFGLTESAVEQNHLSMCIMPGKS